ncbi:MAG: glycosyltransferase [Actinomycetota bacterium]|nr:glycosyltransferase [Actinomycetota bacterium]
MSEREAPPLSVVVPAREGFAEVAELIAGMAPAARAVGAEVVVVGDVSEADFPAEEVRLVRMPVPDMLALHQRGLEEARGDVVAIGEDHAVPRPEWWEAVIRAHRENPGAPAVAGCLVNATDDTLSGRANFLAFAAPWQPPMPALPGHRPPPCSTLSFKRSALEGVTAKSPGWMEAELIPGLFAAGGIVADERIVVDHYQDHGYLWSIFNAFHSARSSYGYQRSRLTGAGRKKVARWALETLPGRLRGEARKASAGRRMPFAESILVTLIALAAGIGAALGVMRGGGRSADLVA